VDNQGQRVHCTPWATGIDRRRRVSEVRRRAAVRLRVRAGVGSRRAAGVRKPLFPVETSKAAVPRGIEESAEPLPRAAARIGPLKEPPPITAAPCAERFPGGPEQWVLVRKDAHGRLGATQAVTTRAEEAVTPCRQRRKDLGVGVPAFSIEGGQA